jgi:ABC-type polysaccharide/polyol phosphate export permease
MVAYPMIFAVARVVVYLAVAAALGALAGAGNWGLAATAVGLALVAFAGLGLIAAALVLVLRQAAGAVAILVTLIGLGSGVGFPRGFLPSWAEALGQLSPLTHALEIARGALFEQRGWAEAAASLGTLLGLTVASVALGYTTLVLGLRWARRRTTLAGY